MKKLLLILSISPCLMATHIEYYGVAHLSGDSIDNARNSTSTIASNSSRLGIKASQKIVNDLTILGQFEIGIDLLGRGIDDGNGGNLSTRANGFITRTRDSFVGMKGGYGTLIVGNISIQNQWIYDYNLFADQVGDLGNILGSAGVGPDRTSGTVSYRLPIVNGFSGLLTYMSTANDWSSSVKDTDESAMLAKLNYNHGNGFKVGISYIRVTLNTTDTTLQDPSEVIISSSYTKDMFSVGGGYAMIFNPTLDNNNRSVWHLGASFSPLSSIKFKAHYVALNDDVSNSDAKMFALGTDYTLSDNTSVYIAYSKTINDSKVAYNSNNWGHGQSALGTPASGLNPSAISIGFIYKFRGAIYEN